MLSQIYPETLKSQVRITVKMAHCETDITECQICFEKYSDVGYQTPRILPCHHSLCERCIDRILGLGSGRFLECPECRVRHMVSENGGARNLQQNKYILAHISAIKSVEAKIKAVTSLSVCKEHGREESLFCRHPCEKPICQTCLLKNFHKFFFCFGRSFTFKKPLLHVYCSINCYQVGRQLTFPW